jgi:hypothetical protein
MLQGTRNLLKMNTKVSKQAGRAAEIERRRDSIEAGDCTMDDDDRLELKKMQERIFNFKKDEKHMVLPEEVGWTVGMMSGRLDQMSVNKFRKPKNDEAKKGYVK